MFYVCLRELFISVLVVVGDKGGTQCQESKSGKVITYKACAHFVV